MAKNSKTSQRRLALGVGALVYQWVPALLAHADALVERCEIYKSQVEAGAKRIEAAEAENKRLRQALVGMLAEWDRLTRYGSPMAKAANKSVAFARAQAAQAGTQP